MFEISVRAWTFSGVIRLCRERETPVSWKDIAKRKQEDRQRVEADRSRAEESRAKLREQLPVFFDSVVAGISAEVEAYNSALPLQSDGIVISRGDRTARFEKTSTPAASLTITLSGPSVVGNDIYAGILTCVTEGRNADGELKTESGHFEIWMRDLGLRIMRRGRDLAYVDVHGVKELVDAIITPLVYFVT
jgi:hypothetical protein